MRRWAIMVAMVLGASPALAQQAPPSQPPSPPSSPPSSPAPVTAEEAIAVTRETYGPPPPQPRCGAAASGGEIVVCAPEDSGQFRVQSTAESDPDSAAHRRMLNDGIPRAPQVGTVIDCSRGGCIGFGSVPPPAYIIDYSAIPEPPVGSDADLISKGEKPAP